MRHVVIIVNVNLVYNMKKTVTKKSVKKEVRPEIFMDMVSDMDVNEMLAEYAIAKIRAGLPITEDELGYICKNVVSSVEGDMFNWNNTLMKVGPGEYIKFDMRVYEIEDTCEKTEKKPGFFKRIWNWITKPFRKN